MNERAEKSKEEGLKRIPAASRVPARLVFFFLSSAFYMMERKWIKHITGAVPIAR
jgi:hypothetical protein